MEEVYIYVRITEVFSQLIQGYRTTNRLHTPNIHCCLLFSGKNTFVLFAAQRVDVVVIFHSYAPFEYNSPSRRVASLLVCTPWSRSSKPKSSKPVDDQNLTTLGCLVVATFTEFCFYAAKSPHLDCHIIHRWYPSWYKELSKSTLTRQRYGNPGRYLKHWQSRHLRVVSCIAQTAGEDKRRRLLNLTVLVTG